jgi:hypothetical protein
VFFICSHYWQVLWMSHRYEFTRAAGEKGLILVFTEGSFESLPFEVRLSARWTGLGYGEITELKMTDRRALLAHGYAVVREAAAEAVEPAAAGHDAPIVAAPSLRKAA